MVCVVSGASEKLGVQGLGDVVPVAEPVPLDGVQKHQVLLGRPTATGNLVARLGLLAPFDGGGGMALVENHETSTVNQLVIVMRFVASNLDFSSEALRAKIQGLLASAAVGQLATGFGCCS